MCLQWTVFYSIHLLYNKITVLVPIYKVLKSIRSRFKEKYSNYRLLFILHKACHFTKKSAPLGWTHCTVYMSFLKCLKSQNVFGWRSSDTKVSFENFPSVAQMAKWKLSKLQLYFYCWRPFIKYVDRILTIFDSLPPFVETFTP